MYSKATLFPKNICNIPFIILPPSKGYIGIKLNIPIRIFEYITNWFSIQKNDILNTEKIIINIKFIKGPANAIIIFFNTNTVPFFIFLL